MGKGTLAVYFRDFMQNSKIEIRGNQSRQPIAVFSSNEDIGPAVLLARNHAEFKKDVNYAKCVSMYT